MPYGSGITAAFFAIVGVQDDAVAFELNLAVKGDVTLAMWFADHVSEVGPALCLCVWR